MEWKEKSYMITFLFQIKCHQTDLKNFTLILAVFEIKFIIDML